MCDHAILFHKHMTRYPTDWNKISFQRRKFKWNMYLVRYDVTFKYSNTQLYEYSRMSLSNIHRSALVNCFFFWYRYQLQHDGMKGIYACKVLSVRIKWNPEPFLSFCIFSAFLSPAVLSLHLQLLSLLLPSNSLPVVSFFPSLPLPFRYRICSCEHP